MGTLHVVGIPVGNLGDVTLRALRVLREVDLVVAPDIPSIQEFLTYYGIDATLIQGVGNGHEGRDAKEMRGEGLVLEALHSHDVALLSDAEGMAASASCQRLVRSVAEQGFVVVAVPGPAGAVTALVTRAITCFIRSIYRFPLLLPRLVDFFPYDNSDHYCIAFRSNLNRKF